MSQSDVDSVSGESDGASAVLPLFSCKIALGGSRDQKDAPPAFNGIEAPLFIPAPHEEIRQRLLSWFPDSGVPRKSAVKLHEKQDAQSYRMTSPSSNKKSVDKISLESPHTLQCELVPTFQSPSNMGLQVEDRDDRPIHTLTVVAFEPDHGSEATLEDETISTIVLGHLLPHRADAQHPLRLVDPALITSEHVTSSCTVTIQPPFLSSKRIVGPDAVHPFGRATPRIMPYTSSMPSNWWDDATKTQFSKDPRLRAPAQLFASLDATFFLGAQALRYGLEPDEDGFVTNEISNAGRAHDRLAIRKLIPRLVNFAVERDKAVTEYESSKSPRTRKIMAQYDPSVIVHIERPRTDNSSTDFFVGGPNTYHSVPARTQRTLPEDIETPAASYAKKRSRKQASSGHDSESGGSRAKKSNKARRSAASSTTITYQAANEHISNQASTDISALSPGDNSLTALLESCRPRDDSPTLYPPEQIITPLMRFQAQALDWMVKKETTAVTSETNLTYPMWIELRMTPSGKDIIAAAESQSPALEMCNGGSFYYDTISGAVSFRRFQCRKNEPGGFLCNTMGLGKTLMTLALIATHPKSPTHIDNSRSHSLAQQISDPRHRPIAIGATLVIVPQAIAAQWLAQIDLHFREADGSKARVYNFRGDSIPWAEKSRDEVRSDALEALQDATIVMTTYETLRAEIRRSEKFVRNAESARSPLLELLFWRVVLDEAQLVGHSNSVAVQTASELWRTNAWVVTATPLSHSVKELSGLLTFLDHDPLASPRVFNELCALAYERGEQEGVRRLRGFLPRILWRHAREHVQDQLTIPTSTVETLSLTLEGLERTIYDREMTSHRGRIERAVLSGRKVRDLDFILQIRQLLSHPQIAKALGYGETSRRMTFKELFGVLLKKASSELKGRRLEFCSNVLTIVWGQQFAEEASIENERRIRKSKNKSTAKQFYRWTAGPQVWDEQTVKKKLHLVVEMCKNAMTELGGDGDEEEETTGSSEPNGPATLAREVTLRFPEVLYWAQTLLEEQAEPPMIWDPERPSKAFYERVTKPASEVHPDDKRWQEVEADAGDDEEMDDGGESTTFDRPALMAQRFRGKTAKRVRRVWMLKPRHQLSTYESAVSKLETRVNQLDHEMRYLLSRAAEEGGVDEADTEDAKTCPICMDDILPSLGCILPCLHSFCTECIQKWVQSGREGVSPVCPACRTPFSVNNITEILATPPENASRDDITGDYGSKITGLIRDFRQRISAESTTKAVIFTSFKRMMSFVYSALMQNGIPCVLFAGTEESRARALAAIRDDDHTRAIIVPMHSSEGAAGLTLTMCQVAYLLEPALSPGLELQAMGRINRIGQTKPTTNVRIVMKDTLEEVILAIADRRASSKDSSVVTRDTLDSKDLCSLFGLDYDEIIQRRRARRTTHVAGEAAGGVIERDEDDVNA